MTATFSVEVDRPFDGVAVITFADAARGNQLCWAAVDRLAACLRDSREGGARVLVLASALEGHWLEHAWLPDLMEALAGGSPSGGGMGWFDAQRELTHTGIVSIAAIGGQCSGGGAELGWACDLRIAEEQATFRQPEADFGLTTGIGGCSRLARLVGRSAVTDMVLTAEALDAPRLYQLGAVTRLVTRGGALPAALALARRLAARSPAALAGLKRILAGSDALPLDEALDREQSIFQEVAAGERAREEMGRAQAAWEAKRET